MKQVMFIYLIVQFVVTTWAQQDFLDHKKSIEPLTENDVIVENGNYTLKFNYSMCMM